MSRADWSVKVSFGGDVGVFRSRVRFAIGYDLSCMGFAHLVSWLGYVYGLRLVFVSGLGSVSCLWFVFRFSSVVFGSGSVSVPFRCSGLVLCWFPVRVRSRVWVLEGVVVRFGRFGSGILRCGQVSFFGWW